MTQAEQQAVYEAIHKVETTLMRDGNHKHNELVNQINQLALTVKEHNGVKSIAKENRECIQKVQDRFNVVENKIDDHIVEHNSIGKVKSNWFTRWGTIVALLIAAGSMIIGAIK